MNRELLSKLSLSDLEVINKRLAARRMQLTHKLLDKTVEADRNRDKHLADQRRIEDAMTEVELAIASCINTLFGPIL